MPVFQTILVPLDGSSLSEQAIPYASTLAQDDSKIVLLQVVPELHGNVATEIDLAYGWSQQAEEVVASKIRSDLEAHAKDLKEMYAFAEVPAVRVILGDPAATILETAQHVRADLIVMTTRGQGAAKRFILGSVTDRVAHHSTTPVFVFRPNDNAIVGQQAAIRRIIVPLDGSALAENALPMASALAQQLGVPILLARALQLSMSMPVVAGTLLVPQQSIDETFQLATDYLTATREPLVNKGLTVATLTEWGTPFDVIDGISGTEDLIMLTSHGRGGFQRWLLGSVADKLMHSSSAPVLLIPVRTGN